MWRERHIYARRTTEKEQRESRMTPIDATRRGEDATSMAPQKNTTDAARAHLLPRRRPPVLFRIKKEDRVRDEV
jgi:hypothetical protein